MLLGKHDWRQLVRPLSLFIFTCVAYFVYVKFCLGTSDRTDTYAFKVVSLADIPDKLAFFVLEASYKAVNLWAVIPSPWIAMVACVVITAGMITKRPVQILLILVSLGLVNTPTLIPAHGHTAHRLLFPYASMLALIFLFFLRRFLRSAWMPFLFTGLCVLGTLAHNNVLRGFAASNAAEFRFLKESLEACPAEEVYIIPPDQRPEIPGLSVFGQPISFDEYGFLSSVYEHDGMVNYALKETGKKIDWHVVRLQDCPWDAFVIDLRHMRFPVPAFCFWPLLILPGLCYSLPNLSLSNGKRLIK